MEMNLGLLFGILAAGLAIFMTIWFAFARYLDRVDVVDSAWGLGFIYVAIIALYSTSGFGDLQLIVLALTIIWGGRLTMHVARRSSEKDEDRRYATYRKKYSDNFWQEAYFRIFLLQGLLILIVSTPAVAILSSTSHGFSTLVIIGLIIWVMGIIIEAVADRQLKSFLKKRDSKEEIVSTGLWRYSRHPNYFGEITVWLGASLAAAGVGRYWGFIGFVVIAILITKVSGIPPVEKRYKSNKAYQAYAKKTSILVPLPPKHL